MSEQRILIVLDEIVGAVSRDRAKAERMKLVDFGHILGFDSVVPGTPIGRWEKAMCLHLRAGDSIYCRGYPGVPDRLRTDAEVLADALDRFRAYDAVISVEPRKRGGHLNHVLMDESILQSFYME